MMAEEIATAGLLLFLLTTSLEIGFRCGRRTAAAREIQAGGHLGAIQGAMLGLLALLLGFSFSGAASRFMERQDLIVTEANAIGTAYLRADVLNEPHRSDLQSSLAQYVEHRLRISATLRHGLTDEARAEIGRLHDRIWRAAREGVSANPAAIMAVLAPVNEVIDLHSTRVAAGRKHLPTLVLGLLVASSALSMAMIGYGCGLAGRRSLQMAGSLALLIGIALWTTMDLDKPRSGLIQLSDAPLHELKLGSPR